MNSKYKSVLNAIALLSPIYIAVLVIMAHPEKCPNILENAFGNGGLLTPLAIIVVGILIKKTTLSSLTLGILAFLCLGLLLYHGIILERMVNGMSLNAVMITIIMAVYLLFALFECVNYEDIGWSENS